MERPSKRPVEPRERGNPPTEAIDALKADSEALKRCISVMVEKENSVHQGVSTTSPPAKLKRSRSKCIKEKRRRARSPSPSHSSDINFNNSSNVSYTESFSFADRSSNSPNRRRRHRGHMRLKRAQSSRLGSMLLPFASWILVTKVSKSPKSSLMIVRPNLKSPQPSSIRG